jgi:hypothetical protein
MRNAFAWILSVGLGLSLPLGCAQTDGGSSAADRAAAPAGSTAQPEGAAGMLQGPIFEEVAEQVGLSVNHVNGMSGGLYYVEPVGSGAALFDYDADGDLDLYLVQGHALSAPGEGDPAPDGIHLDQLFQNRLVPDGQLAFKEVTEASGIRADGYGMGVAVGDYDNDGHPDLYVTNWGPNQLWRNLGDGRFEDVTQAAGVEDERFSTSASFLDIDRDGWLDLMATNYNRYRHTDQEACTDDLGRATYCGPSAYPSDPDRLWRNRGDGTFEDISVSAGITAHYGPGLGIVAADFDRDGWTDIYVANDGAENQLWMNQGGSRFEDRALLAGAAVNRRGMSEASMGLAAEDFDGDGDEDLFMTHLATESSTYYQNDGQGAFDDQSQGSGLGEASTAFTAFGVSALDVDNDGWLDLYVANGAVELIYAQVEAGVPHALKMPDQLFRNLGDGRFDDLSARAGPVFAQEEVGRGTAQGDIDNDGDMDLVVVNNAGPLWLLQNQVGQEKPWLGLRLLTADGRRDALGASVGLELPQGGVRWRRVHADGSYLSSSDPRVVFGLGDGLGDPAAFAGAEVGDAPRSVSVRWPDGSAERWTGLEIQQYHALVQGQGEPVND